MPCPSEPWRVRVAAPVRAGLLLTATLALGCAVPPGTPASPTPATPTPDGTTPPATAATPAAPASAPVALVLVAEPAGPAVVEAQLARLLDFHERTRALTAPEAAREQARLAADAGGEATLQLAWLLAQGRNSGDLARALALLDPLARADAPEAPLARMLMARLAEQRRLEDQLERQAQQQRELQRRNEQLREQIDALRAIERSLGPRPPASAPRTP